MTIAACYLSPEGVVLGADSTSTYTDAIGKRYYNHAQKLFEIGENGTAGVVTWGLAGLNVSSYRTLIATFADSFKHKRPKTMADLAKYWSDHFWLAYSKAPYLKDVFLEAARLSAKRPNDPAVTPVPSDMRSIAEENSVLGLKQNCSVGFCLAGYVLPDRTPKAYSLLVDPFMTAAPNATELQIGWQFWGAPGIVHRVQFGVDAEFKQKIKDTGKWSGSEAELDQFIGQFKLEVPVLPIRDAIDFVHTTILNTIKTLKFTSHEPICGGPIELSVVTSDRPFRWVRHKEWSSAIEEIRNGQH